MPTLHWLNRDEHIKLAGNAPYRILKEVPELSFGDKNTGNMIVQGDNLDALKALLPFYAGQVKCIYIDPPYNTGNAFEHYDDNLEHSIWLEMMYPRLKLLREFLSLDGFIWVSIDDREQAYLKVIMDEIFGRNNFVADITYERSGSAGLGQGGTFVNNSEHLLVYNRNSADMNNVLGVVPLELKTMKRYKSILLNRGSRTLVKSFIASNGKPVNVYRHSDFKIGSVSLRSPETRMEEIKSDFLLNFNYLFRTNNVQKENEFQNNLMREMEPNSLYTVDYTPSRGKYNGQEITLYYYNKGLFAWLKDTAFIENNQIMKTNKLTTVWKHEDLPKADLANEGGVEFPRSKKPEQLMKRIIELSSNKNDIIMDSFLGSGTTAAVAHKMERKYIGIEMGNHAKTLCQKRLMRVVDGSDRLGISNSVNWQGGGGFRFFELGDEIFDEYGQIKESITFEQLSAHIWFTETYTPINLSTKKTTFLGLHNRIAYSLLYNGILHDRSVNGGNVLTKKTLDIIKSDIGSVEYDKIVIYGECSRLNKSTLDSLNIEFKQTPYDVKAR